VQVVGLDAPARRIVLDAAFGAELGVGAGVLCTTVIVSDPHPATARAASVAKSRPVRSLKHSRMSIEKGIGEPREALEATDLSAPEESRIP
jgi:hypothetical protein